MSAEPKTRRQLREALRNARAETRALRGAIHDAGISYESSWSVSFGTYRDIDVTLKGITTKETLNAAVEAARAETRRYTLQTVIDALELRDYRRSTDPLSSLLDRRPDRTEPDPDRFWSDLQTALEVRAEKKTADARAATEAKVAGIARHPNGSGFFVLGDMAGFDPAFPRVADLLKREDASWLNLISDPGAGGSSYSAATTLPKPAAAAKKSAKKKAEGKK